MAGTVVPIGTLRDGFFDAQIQNNVPDRVYSAKDYATLFDGVVSDGVFPSAGNHFHLSANGTTSINIQNGRAWLNSHWIYLPDTYQYDFSGYLAWPSQNGYRRVHAVCIYYSENDRQFSIRVFQSNIDEPIEISAWWTNQYMPNLSKDSDANDDAIYSIGYILFEKSSSGTQSIRTFDTVYSKLETYSPSDYMGAIISYNDPSQKIFYATPYASALMDLDIVAENRFTSIETKLNSAYTWAQAFNSSKSAYDNAYSWAQAFNSSKSAYTAAYTWALAFNSSKSAYDNAYSWAQAFNSSKSAYDSAYTWARLAYEATFPSQSGIIPEVVSKVNEMWPKVTDWDVAGDYVRGYRVLNTITAKIVHMAMGHEQPFYSTMTQTLTSTNRTATSAYIVLPSASVWGPGLEPAIVGADAWFVEIDIDFMSKPEQTSSIIDLRNLSLLLHYEGQSGIWHNGGTTPVTVAGNLNDLAYRTGHLHYTTVVPGEYWTGSGYKRLVDIRPNIRQLPVTSTNTQSIICSILAIPHGSVVYFT